MKQSERELEQELQRLSDARKAANQAEQPARVYYCESTQTLRTHPENYCVAVLRGDMFSADGHDLDGALDHLREGIKEELFKQGREPLELILRWIGTRIGLPGVPNFRPDISRDTANRAFNGTSWSPEKRGAHMIEEYQGMLAGDWQEIKAMCEKAGKPEEFEPQFTRYRQGFREKFNSWLYAKSNCISSMIAGPSKFPTRRAEKANRSEDNRYNELKEFRERAFKAIRKTLFPFGDGSVISALDPEAVAKLREKLAHLTAVQERMKAANKIVKDKKLSPDVKVARLCAEFKFSESSARKLLEPDFCGRTGFADYELRNNLANMKRVEQRIEELTRQAERAPVEMTADNGVEIFEDEGRVQIRFPGKPDEKVRAALRGRGFKWSPNRMTWVRQSTAAALAAAQEIVSNSGGVPA